MANVIEVSIRGVDEATKVFNKIESNADKAFSDIEGSIESIPDIDVDAEVNAQQAEKQIDGIESAAGEAESALRQIPDPKINGNQPKQQLEDIEDQAEDTQEAVEGIDFGAIAGGLVAGGGIAGAVEKALDVSSLDTQIQVAFDISDESIEAVKSSVRTVESYGVDAEGALEGVRRQFALNADASDEANQRIIEGAGAISSVYSEVDFTELIQEVNEIGSELKITDDDALGLTSSLLKIGFPPGEIDIIAEYGKQLTDAGYEAEEIQSIMQAGVETGTWNIDILLDGLKEGRILISEFGTGVDDSMAEILEGTSISAEQLETWGKAVAGGGEEGSQAMQDVAKALDGVEDASKRNELGVKLFGTMYEEQGQNIIDTLLNAEGATANLEDGQKGVNEAVQSLDDSPAVSMKQAMQEMNTALEPLYSGIANVVSMVAGWIQRNPQLTATITAIVTVIGILMGIFMALSPIITAITSLMGVLGVSFTAVSAPILIVIGAIVALIAIGVLLWQNWDVVSQFLVDSWNWIKETAIAIWNGLKVFFVAFWNYLKETFTRNIEIIKTVLSVAWSVIKTVVTTVWNGIKAFFSIVWNAIVTVVTTYINTVQTIISTVFNVIKNIITTIWNTIKNVSSTVWNTIVSVVTSIINGFKTGIQTAFSAIRNVITTIWNTVNNVSSSVWEGIRNSISYIIDGISSTISKVFNTIKRTITNVWEGIKRTTSRIWDGIVSAVKAPINTIIGFINGMINALNGISINIPQIPDWVPGIGGRGGGTIGFSIPNIPSLATGGVVSEPTLAMVGDAGAGNPEIVAPQKMIAQIVGSEIKKALQELFSRYRAPYQTPQPLQIYLRLGRSEFVTFVEDINSELQEIDADLEDFR